MPTHLRRRRPIGTDELAPQDTVEVRCHRCKFPFLIERDALRELNDTDRQPECGRSVRLCVRDDPNERKLDEAGRKTKVTRLDKVLLALVGLTATADSAGKFDIVVEVWRQNRRLFGLRGYEEEYPDSNAVIVVLMHLKTQKLVEPAGVNRYRPTAWGRKYAERLTKTT